MTATAIPGIQATVRTQTGRMAGLDSAAVADPDPIQGEGDNDAAEHDRT